MKTIIKTIIKTTLCFTISAAIVLAGASSAAAATEHPKYSDVMQRLLDMTPDNGTFPYSIMFFTLITPDEIKAVQNEFAEKFIAEEDKAAYFERLDVGATMRYEYERASDEMNAYLEAKDAEYYERMAQTLGIEQSDIAFTSPIDWFNEVSKWGVDNTGTMCVWNLTKAKFLELNENDLVTSFFDDTDGLVEDFGSHDNREKLPQKLIDAMENASDSELIGMNDDPHKPSTLRFYVRLGSAREDVEYALELFHIIPLLKKAGVDWRQVDTLDDTYYFDYETYDIPDSRGSYRSAYDNAVHPEPKMPDGSSIWEKIDYPGRWREETLCLADVGAALTKAQILALCELDDVVCFAYEDESLPEYRGMRYLRFTSNDALGILRTSVGLGGKTEFSESDYPDALWTDVNYDGIADSADALIALQDSIGGSDFDSFGVSWRISDGCCVCAEKQYPIYPLDEVKYYSVSCDEVRYETAQALADSAERVVVAWVDDVTFTPYTDDMESLTKDLTIPEDGDHGKMLTTYKLNIEWEPKQGGTHTGADNDRFTVFGGIELNSDFAALHYNDVKNLGAEQRKAAGGLVPIIEDSSRFLPSGRYIILLDFDEDANVWTLHSHNQGMYDSYFGTDGNRITGVSIGWALQK